MRTFPVSKSWLSSCLIFDPAKIKIDLLVTGSWDTLLYWELFTVICSASSSSYLYSHLTLLLNTPGPDIRAGWVLKRGIIIGTSARRGVFVCTFVCLYVFMYVCLYSCMFNAFLYVCMYQHTGSSLYYKTISCRDNVSLLKSRTLCNQE